MSDILYSFEKHKSVHSYFCSKTAYFTNIVPLCLVELILCNTEVEYITILYAHEYTMYYISIYTGLYYSAIIMHYYCTDSYIALYYIIVLWFIYSFDRFWFTIFYLPGCWLYSSSDKVSVEAAQCLTYIVFDEVSPNSSNTSVFSLPKTCCIR